MSWNVWSLTENRWLLLKSVRSRTAADRAIKAFLAHEHDERYLEPRMVKPHLEQHGTTLMQFKPEAIWRMAMSDWDRRAGNQGADVARMKHYNFHRDHVRKANTANDILRAAIEDPAIGRESGKKITRLLYSDVEQLKAALR